MTPVVQQAGESLTDEEVITMYSTWNDRAGSSYAELIQDAYALGRHRALASRPQQPQAETPLTDEQIDRFLVNFGEVPQLRKSLTKWCRMLVRAALTEFAGAHPPEAVSREDFDKLSADLTRAKNLLVRLHSKFPETRSQIEGSTGTWFIWGTDRDAASPPEARAAAGWISVEEKMPEPDSGEVLVWLTGGRCAFDEWHTHREDPTGMSTTHTIDMGLMWRDYEFEDITHWMPLPLPPEAQEPKT